MQVSDLPDRNVSNTSPQRLIVEPESGRFPTTGVLGEMNILESNLMRIRNSVNVWILLVASQRCHVDISISELDPNEETKYANERCSSWTANQMSCRREDFLPKATSDRYCDAGIVCPGLRSQKPR